MGRVREDFAEMVDNSAPLRRLRQHILEPMECLDHSHRGTPRPKKPTGCGRFELDYLIAQTNRSEACINQDFDALVPTYLPDASGAIPWVSRAHFFAEESHGLEVWAALHRRPSGR